MADVELALLIDRFMRRIHSSLQSKASDFDTENVGPAGGMVLLTIEELGAPEMHRLTERFARDKSQMTRIIKSLETKGLVARRTSELDARVSILSLTLSGEKVVATLKSVLAETINDILRPASETEKRILAEVLHRVLS